MTQFGALGRETKTSWISSPDPHEEG